MKKVFYKAIIPTASVYNFSAFLSRIVSLANRENPQNENPPFSANILLKINLPEKRSLFHIPHCRRLAPIPAAG